MSLADKLAKVEGRPDLPGAPVDPVQVVSQASGVDLVQTAKVIAAVRRMDLQCIPMPYVKVLGKNVVSAIENKTAQLVYYMYLGEAAYSGAEIRVPAVLLLPESRASDMCNGCQEAVECALQSLSTPQECRVGRHAHVPAHIVRATRTTVRLQVDHPIGFYEVSLKALLSAGVPNA